MEPLDSIQPRKGVKNQFDQDENPPIDFSLDHSIEGLFEFLPSKKSL